MRSLLAIALAGFFAAGVAGSTSAATLTYTGTLTLGLSIPPPVVTAIGTYTAAGTGVGVYVGPAHVSTITFTGGTGRFENATGEIAFDYTILSSELDEDGNPTKLTYTYWGAGNINY